MFHDITDQSAPISEIEPKYECYFFMITRKKWQRYPVTLYVILFVYCEQSIGLFDNLRDFELRPPLAKIYHRHASLLIFCTEEGLLSK